MWRDWLALGACLLGMAGYAWGGMTGVKLFHGVMHRTVMPHRYIWADNRSAYLGFVSYMKDVVIFRTGNDYKLLLTGNQQFVVIVTQKEWLLCCNEKFFFRRNDPFTRYVDFAAGFRKQRLNLFQGIFVSSIDFNQPGLTITPNPQGGGFSGIPESNVNVYRGPHYRLRSQCDLGCRDIGPLVNFFKEPASFLSTASRQKRHRLLR